MTAKLIPLNKIPVAARCQESQARREAGTLTAALVWAEYRIVVAEGCHSRPYFDPPVVGWVVTKAAAEAYTAQVTRMPDGSTHRRASFEQIRY